MDVVVRTCAALCLLALTGLAQSDPELTDGWAAVRENAGGHFSGDPFAKKGGGFVVSSKGMLGVEKSFENTRLLAEVTLKTILPSGSGFGIRLSTDDGAELTLSVVADGNGVRSRFDAASGGKPAGTREQPVGEGSPTLRLARDGDVFTGTVQVGDAAPATVGALTWPALSAKTRIRFFATSEGGDQGSVTCFFSRPVADTYERVLSRARRRWGIGAMPDAEEEFKRVTSAFGYTEEAADAMGMFYCQWGRIDDMERVFRAGIEANPKSSRLLNNLSWELVARGLKLADAIGFAERAAALSPEKASVLDTLGWAHHRAGHPKEARKWLQKAVAMHRKEPRTKRVDVTLIGHLAQVHAAAGEKADRKALLEDAIVLARESKRQAARREGYREGDLGQLLLMAGRIDEAEKELLEAVKLIDDHAMYSASDVPVYEAMGDVHVAKDGAEKALPFYKRAYDTAATFHMTQDQDRIREKALALFK